MKGFYWWWAAAWGFFVFGYGFIGYLGDGLWIFYVFAAICAGFCVNCLWNLWKLRGVQ